MNNQLTFWANPQLMFVKMMIAIARAEQHRPVIIVITPLDPSDDD